MILPNVLQIADSFDPDDRRRRQILSIILLFFIAGGLFSIVATFSCGDPFLDVIRDPEARLVLLSSVSAVAAFGLLFVLNRYHRAESLAGWLFVLLLIAIISVSDTPGELVGRGMIIWTLPILAGGIVLPPLAVFAATLIVSITNIYISTVVLNQSSNPYVVAIFFAIAALTWLGMSVTNRAIQTARVEAQKNAAILNGVADGVVVLNENDQVVLANPVALSLMGSGLAQLVMEKKNQQELRGRVLAFEWSDVGGVGRVAIVRDISRQIEVERAKDAILGVVSHEMRTPLTAVIGFAEVIAMQAGPVSEMAVRIRDNAQRLMHMVNNLLDHAQLQSSALKINRDIISLYSLMQAVTSPLSGLTSEKNVSLRTEIDPTLPETIVGDSERLQQILVNLVGNAIKFTDHGEVSISFQNLESKPANTWQILVRDTGIGIPGERLPDVFEPLRRGADYATRSHQGAGLGLSIVKNLVERMDGNIEVESTVGKGSLFTITLPLEKGTN
jgi:signal transduction histidine kinase